MPRFTPLVDALPSEFPFTAPERLARDRGRPLALRLGANESVFGVADGVREAMVAALAGIGYYGDPESLELRDEIARRHGVSPGNVSVGAGIDDLLGLAVRVLLEPGAVGVGPRGGYPMFPFHVAGYGGRLETVPYRDDRCDLPGLAAAARRHGACLVYLANPDNPSGSVAPAAEVGALLGELPEDAVLLLDQAYAELAPHAAETPAVDDGRVICLRTFSKAFGMAGARVGYALASAATVRAFDKVRAHFAVNRVAQAGALTSLRGRDSFLDRVRALNAAGLAAYAELGAVLGAPTLPSATNFALFDFGTATRADAVLAALDQRGVFVRKPVVPPLDRCVRVSVGTPEERARFGEILRELRSAGVF